MITSVFSLKLCKKEKARICILAVVFDIIVGVDHIQ